MLLLLMGSAFFSGAETAFFNLSRRQIDQLQSSRHKLHNLVARVLRKPKALLGCFLFGNTVVNILFYATASVFTVKIEDRFGVTAAAVTAICSFMVLVLWI